MSVVKFACGHLDTFWHQVSEGDSIYCSICHDQRKVVEVST